MKGFKKLFYLLLIGVMIISCAKNYYQSLSGNRKTLITSELITEILSTREESHLFGGEVRFYVDTTLKFRPYLNLFRRKDNYPIKFTPPLDLSIKVNTSRWDVLKFTLPEELKGHFAIRPSFIDSARIEIDTVNVIYMSPLLPTGQKSIYYIHEYVVFNQYLGEGYFRKCVTQNFYFYGVNKKKMEKLKVVKGEIWDFGSGLKEPGSKPRKE